jgi:hypothetical protein
MRLGIKIIVSLFLLSKDNFRTWNNIPENYIFSLVRKVGGYHTTPFFLPFPNCLVCLFVCLWPPEIFFSYPAIQITMYTFDMSNSNDLLFFY